MTEEGPVPRRLLRLLSLLTAAAALTACGVPDLQQMNFRVDNRLHFVSPHDRALVAQPVTLTWTIRDFDVAPPGSGPRDRHKGYFAIFVDRQPVKPGQTMKAVASGDRFCQKSPSCPDASYLAQRQVYTTTQTTFRLPQVLPIAGDSNKVQLHRIVVVLMDTSGHRIGESNWELDLRIRKPGAG